MSPPHPSPLPPSPSFTPLSPPEPVPFEPRRRSISDFWQLPPARLSAATLWVARRPSSNAQRSRKPVRSTKTACSPDEAAVGGSLFSHHRQTDHFAFPPPRPIPRRRRRQLLRACMGTRLLKDEPAWRKTAYTYTTVHGTDDTRESKAVRPSFSLGPRLLPPPFPSPPDPGWKRPVEKTRFWDKAWNQRLNT
ncbi:hypothetical protein XA68_16061 [Ophiocordyceps unilateralis]|uniref:Uncharacterized protein n=1 Tax=Ophiocordyceps unilateralis TaxID=268505 RepID=A0A2A9P736_OPHUN|nr:hypothetical protein XA68_16061 [Ophiocordyceps unilateralis]